MKFVELVDISELLELCESFTALTNAVTAILDLEGHILIATGWQDICTRFHRVNPKTACRCTESDTVIAGQLKKGERYNIYKCKNGLVDVAVHITVGGEHVDKFFSGQFLFEPPDVEFFSRQAEEFGFDKTAYLDALSRVPIYTEDQVKAMMDFFSRLARLIGEMGLARKGLEEANIELRKHQEHLEELVRERTEELVEAKERAEKANRAKSVFLANMSHELRTPLNAVLGFAQLMKVSPDATMQQIESLDIITRSGEHLLNLINNVLDISKIESGRVLLEESTTDLHQIMQEMQSLMYVRAKEKGLNFTVEQSSDFPHYVNVDSGKLRQVLINLIGNAVKYTKTGGVILHAEVVKWEPTQSARVRFDVEDSGPGIRAEDLERIFQPFVQLADQPVAEAGTGLGLAICKQYVELMGGLLGVTSELGIGSVFYFELPVAVLPVEEMLAVSRHGRVIGVEKGQPSYRLLIVEDQPENRLLLYELLKPLGFNLREAVNGQEAIEIFEQWHPDLIWMDVRMPVMDGSEATRRIKLTEAGTHTKVIALTAHALEDERREILASGYDDFIRKPYKDSEIFDALAKHLDIRFQYADEYPSTAEKKAWELNADQLYELPQDLTDELLKAAELLDGPRILEVISHISDINHELGERLRRMVENLQYKELLKVLDNFAEKRAL